MTINSNFNSNLKNTELKKYFVNLNSKIDFKRGFGSDNHAPIHPDILSAINLVNQGHFPSYGNDPWTEHAKLIFKNLFGNHTESSFVFNGTAANVLSLKTSVQSYHAVLCSDISHLYWDECGAPEFIAGCKLLTVKTIDGKIDPNYLEESWLRRGDQHYSQIQMISITQPTEVGTVYSIDELKTIIDWAKSKNILVHMDGARIANAAFTLNTSLKSFTTDLDVDLLSFGGSKNGFLLGESVIFLNPTLFKNFQYIRKQGLQLPSKSRFIAAQFLAYFHNDLYLSIAQHSCLLAKKLEELLMINNLTDYYQIQYSVQSNAVFLKIPKDLVKNIRQEFFFYVWNEKDFTCRLMMNWDTQESDLLSFIEILKRQIKI